MAKLLKSIAAFLERARVAILNTIDIAEIKGYVAPFGYNDAELAKGKKLLEDAVKACEMKATLHGGQTAKSKELEAARKAAVDACQTLISVIKATWYGDRTVLARLGLNGPVPRTTGGLMDIGLKLFDNVIVNLDIKAKLAARTYTDAKLAAEKAKVMAYAGLNNQQEAAKGAAQQATLEQTKTLRMLEIWYNSFVRIAKVALKDKPELAEKLGIRHRTGKVG